MIAYKLTTKDGEVTISVDSEQPHKVAPIEYQGLEKAILTVKRWLYYETGSYGQQIADWAAPADLKAAMGKPGSRPFAPTLLEETMGTLNRSAGADPESGG